MCSPLQAQQKTQYDAQMLRMAEILGSLHYLRNLCSTPTTQWRDKMVQMIEKENPSPERRSRLYAAFNNSYRSFSQNYTNCTSAALEADKRYISEGIKLSKDMLERFGN